MSEIETPARRGDIRFRMLQAIPPYLIAIAVGELSFRATVPRTGVWANRACSIVPLAVLGYGEDVLHPPWRSVRSLSLCGFDLLVCPPRFPIGGMENPLLTFATPTNFWLATKPVACFTREFGTFWSATAFRMPTGVRFRWLTKASLLPGWRIQ